MMNEKAETKVQVGSDNVFADLDLPNPEERLIKAELASRISDIIRQKKLNPSTQRGCVASRLTTI